MTDQTDVPASKAGTDNPASREQKPPPKSLLDVPEAQRARMSREDTEAFVRLSFADREARVVPIEEAWAELGGKSPQTTILVGRLRNVPDLTVRVPVLLLASWFCDSPGRCVLWAYTIVVLTRRLGRAITVSDLADAFPWGFPTDEGAGMIWDAQKEPRGNRLDFAESWQAPIAGVAP